MGHQKQWEFLQKKFETGTLSHAYLFLGAENLGKKDFAIELVKLINCASLKEGKPCQKCPSCLAIEKRTFPDLLLIKKKDDKSEIEISQIREVQNFLSYKSYYGSFKSVITENADQMNLEAQSCFLKTLEEPKGNTLLILISSKPDLILPTIYSRCQAVKFFGNPKEDPQKLQLEKEILDQIIKVTSSDFSEKFKYAKALDLEKNSLSEILKILLKYFRQQLLAKTIGPKNLDAEKYTLQKIKDNIKLIEDINDKIAFTNANPKLALEILLMEI
jgi:DNA polymerase-3 subunit delta'